MMCSLNREIPTDHIFNRVGIVLWLAVLSCSAISAHAQISFTSAIDLAIRNSPRVRMAQDDVNKALASLSDAKAVFIPSITGSSGLGASSGISLNVPTIFTISAQSLVFNDSQRDYIRAATLGVQSSRTSYRRLGQRPRSEEGPLNRRTDSAPTASARRSNHVISRTPWIANGYSCGSTFDGAGDHTFRPYRSIAGNDFLQDVSRYFQHPLCQDQCPSEAPTSVWRCTPYVDSTGVI